MGYLMSHKTKAIDGTIVRNRATGPNWTKKQAIFAKKIAKKKDKARGTVKADPERKANWWKCPDCGDWVKYPIDKCPKCKKTKPEEMKLTVKVEVP